MMYDTTNAIKVIAIDDDRDVPLVGRIVKWLDAEHDRCLVLWGNSLNPLEAYMDELAPWHE